MTKAMTDPVQDAYADAAAVVEGISEHERDGYTQDALFEAQAAILARAAEVSAKPALSDFGKSFAATVEAFDSLPAASQIDHYRTKAKADAARIAALEARVKELNVGLRFYSCADGCNECHEHERDRVNCGWTARALIETDTPTQEADHE